LRKIRDVGDKGSSECNGEDVGLDRERPETRGGKGTRGRGAAEMVDGGMAKGAYGMPGVRGLRRCRGACPAEGVDKVGDEDKNFGGDSESEDVGDGNGG
jgi:hypothetical protein